MITNAVINGLYIFLIVLIAYDIVCEICELIRSVKKK